MKIKLKLKLKMELLEEKEDGLQLDRKYVHQSDKRRRKIPLFLHLGKTRTYRRSNKEQQSGPRKWGTAKSPVTPKCNQPRIRFVIDNTLQTQI